MSLNLQNQALTLPINTEFPGTMQDLLDLIAQYLAIAGQADFSGINFGPTTPAPADQDRPWFKTDNSGNPIGWFTWNGSAWVQLPLVPQSGGSAGRPITGSPGEQFFDTDIRRMLIWDGSGNWVTADGGSGEVRFVRGTDSSAILTNNPGWTLVTDMAACTLAVAGDGTGRGFSDRAAEAGSPIGEEAHILTADENGPHSHNYDTFGTLHGTAGANPIFANPVNGVTGPSGSGGSLNTPPGHNNMQPTWFLFCIQKT